MGKRSASFNQRLVQRVVERLRGGDPPEALRAELQTRLDPAEADAFMSQAEAQLAPNSARGDWISRILAALAYGWTAILLIQNIAVITTIGHLEWTTMSTAEHGVVMPLAALALAKILVLFVAAAAFSLRPNLPATLFFGLAILFAFPLGMFVSAWVAGGRTEDPSLMVTVSAICSYVAALCAVAIHLRSRRLAPNQRARTP